MLLLTPSVSPPSARSFFPQPYRISDKASPAKRPRLASTSSHLQSNLSSASSSSTSLDQIDVHQAREASTLRLFDVWSTLADRYSRPLDEDDIIDITTGEVVKDRGVLRGSRNWEIGCFADNVEEEEYEEEEDDDDVDELDSFANTGAGGELDGVPVGIDGRRVPPVTEIDPADAEDLKQFLEAEQRRREICGGEEETESSDEEGFVGPGLQDSAHSESINALPLGRSATPQVEEEGGLDVETDQTPRRERSVFVDSGSDDELVNWDLDEASMIYRLPKKKEEEENGDDGHDDDIEFINTPTLHPPSSSPPRTKSKQVRKASKKKSDQSAPKSTSSKTYKLPRRQLQTPPRSQSSLNSSTTPSEDCFPPPLPDLLDQWPSSPASFSHGDSSPTERWQAKSHLRKFDSRSQCPGASQGDQDVLPLPIPRLDLAKIAQGRAASKSKSNTKPMLPPRAKEKASQLASTSLILEKAVDQRGQDSVSDSLSHLRDKPSAPKKSRPHVEVVIKQRPPFLARTPAPDAPFSDRLTSQKGGKTSATKSSPGGRDIKGKGREIVTQDSQESISEAGDESDDPITILSSSPVSASDGIRRSHSLKREDPQSSSDAVLPSAVDEEQMNVIEPPKLKYGEVVASSTSRGMRKRKRVASSSSQVDVVDLDDTHKSPVPAPQNKTAVCSDQSSFSRTRIESIPNGSSTSTLSGELMTRHKPPRKSTPIAPSRSRAKPGPSNHDRGSSPASSQEDFGEPHHHSHRAPSHFDPAPRSDPSYYAYHQPPYTPHHAPPHIYPPIADPRAQYIISQAMHQLSALVAGPWTPPTHGSIPYTPSHHHTCDPSSMYSTPTHLHTYLYAYDPNLSRATLPPDSPEVLSSPAVPGGSSVRRKSLVKRSRSRGRRVSFRVEEECVDTTEIRSRPASAREREDTSRERDRSRVQPSSEIAVRKGVEGKGRAKADVAQTGSDTEPELVRRGRSFSRAQTPGPPIRTQSSNTRLKSGDQSTSAIGRGRSHSVVAAGHRT